MKRAARRKKSSISLASPFGPGDFKGIYVAILSGTFISPLYGFVYLDANGSGGVTGSWEIEASNGTILGGLGQSTYTVTPQGKVELTLASTTSSNVLSVTVFLADQRQSILGRGGFTLGGTPPPRAGVGAFAGGNHGGSGPRF